MKKNKKILVDMTCSILHHGHIRLLKKASKYGKVIVSCLDINSKAAGSFSKSLKINNFYTNFSLCKTRLQRYLQCITNRQQFNWLLPINNL